MEKGEFAVQKFTLKNPMPPQWLMYPNIVKGCIGWRMGSGESYRYVLGDWLESLTESERKKYRELFPLPKQWYDYDDEYSDDYDESADKNIFVHNGYFTYFWQKDGKPVYSKKLLEEQISKGEKAEFLFFWGHTPSKSGALGKECFSQWWLEEFDGLEHYYCMEQYMMAEKARFFGDKEIEKQIMQSNSPHDMKALGRKVKNFDEQVWDKVKYSIVLNGSYYKFMQNEKLRDFLLSTGDKVLVEASPYDRVWGIGMSAKNDGIDKPSNWRGQNLLGFALMEVRDEIRNVCKNYDKIDWDLVKKTF